MFYSLLAFFALQSSAAADYPTQTQQYKYSEQWKDNTQLKVYICDHSNNKIQNQDVLDAINFWNKKDINVRIDKLYKTKKCELQGKNNAIVISDLQQEIDRNIEYGTEVTYTERQTDIIKISYIEINTGRDVSKEIVRKAIFHEIGHSLGIKHCINCNINDLMRH